MSWKQRYRIRSYLRSSLWIVPVLAGMAERVFRIIVEEIEWRLDWAGVGLGLEGAKSLTSAVITLSLSFVVFTFGSLLVAIQVASGQYTPRIIATTLLRDNVIRYTVGLVCFHASLCRQDAESPRDNRAAARRLLSPACSVSSVWRPFSF